MTCRTFTTKTTYYLISITKGSENEITFKI